MDGFQIELMAAEPLILNPVAMEIDEKGRMHKFFFQHSNILSNKSVIFTINSSSSTIMASITKPTRQAKAIFELYRAMPENVQGEILKMILNINIESTSSETMDYSGWSEESLKEIWDTPENDHWDDFFKSNGYV